VDFGVIIGDHKVRGNLVRWTPVFGLVDKPIGARVCVVVITRSDSDVVTSVFVMRGLT
jgi:hypothetical protein